MNRASLIVSMATGLWAVLLLAAGRPTSAGWLAGAAGVAAAAHVTGGRRRRGGRA